MKSLKELYNKVDIWLAEFYRSFWEVNFTTKNGTDGTGPE